MRKKQIPYRICRNLSLNAAVIKKMGKKRFGPLTVCDMRTWCKRLGFFMPKCVTKRQAEASLVAVLAARKIQRWAKRTFLAKAKAISRIKKHVALFPQNRDDMVMLEPLPHKSRVFKLVLPDRTVIGFNAARLAEFILDSGTFEDPVTRHPFNEAELHRLDCQVRRLGYQRRSTLHLFRHPEIVKAKKDKASLVMGLERMAGEMVAMMIQVAEGGEASRDVLMLLDNDYFPQWHGYFRQLVAVDPHSGYSGLVNYKGMVVAALSKAPSEENGLLTPHQKRNRMNVLRYILELLNTHQVRGFGGAPPPAPVVYQLPDSSLSALHAAVDPVAEAQPGLSVFQLVQFVSQTALDGGEREQRFPPPDANVPIFVVPTAAVIPDTGNRNDAEIPTTESADRPIELGQAMRRMEEDA